MQIFVTGLLGAIAIGACNGGDVDGEIQRGQIMSELRAAVCRARARCEAAPDFQSCLAVVHPLRPEVEAHLASGKVGYDPVAARKLIDHLDSSALCLRSEVQSRQGQLAQLTSFSEAFPGTVALGGTCQMDEDCVSQRCELPVSGCDEQCCPGTCGAIPPPQPRGAECGYGVGYCEVDSTCGAPDPMTQERVCRALVEIGQRCEPELFSFPCVPGADCVGPPGVETCQAYPATGQPCVPVFGAACNDVRDLCTLTGETFTCQRPAPLGAACGPAVPCSTGGEWCDPASSTCIAKGRVGESCRTPADFPEDCLDGLRCGANKKCTPRPVTPAGCP
jgi:hypothetical protein